MHAKLQIWLHVKFNSDKINCCVHAGLFNCFRGDYCKRKKILNRWIYSVRRKQHVSFLHIYTLEHDRYVRQKVLGPNARGTNIQLTDWLVDHLFFKLRQSLSILAICLSLSRASGWRIDDIRLRHILVVDTHHSNTQAHPFSTCPLCWRNHLIDIFLPAITVNFWACALLCLASIDSTLLARALRMHYSIGVYVHWNTLGVDAAGEPW